MRRIPRLLALSAAFVCVPSLALASPGEVAKPLDNPEIYGGEPVNTCGWPTTVELDGCTGTLVHPEVVLFAGHCIEFGGNPSEARFGDDFNQPARTVATAECGYDNNWPTPGRDLAWCRLAEPVNDIPIVPPLMGCETDQLQIGSEVTIVGFGAADDNLGWGPKREVTTTVTDLDGIEAYIGGGGLDSCSGDSGGPVFIQLDDGTWRVFGITSRGGECGGGGIYEIMHLSMPWFEQQIGMDITPCTDADGNWDPNELCTGAPFEPHAADNWSDACSNGDVSGPISTCGEPFGDGDGDPDPTGDGDGDPDPTTTGDGDGDPDPTTTGDGDGDPDPTGAETDGDEGTDSGDPATGDGDGETDDSDGETGGGPGLGDEEGCNCTSSDRGSGSAPLTLLGGLLLLGLRRRRAS